MITDFKPFENMNPEDYENIGFKAGLEVHQQLLTEKKLFCHCPAGKYSTHYDAQILRHMRPTLSELGEYDGTALMEFKTKKNIVYRINKETVCTYEMDDAPPFNLNEKALDIALEIGFLFNCNPVDELHITRKQYLDGSIPTGFQRTGITGVNGNFKVDDKEIGVIQISLEEDSCREVSDIGHIRTYLTDRLGMPLIEVVTRADMKTPQEIERVVNEIRRINRATHKVRTGYGSGREDVNVSVRGGTRIEIKGVPQETRIPRLAYNEARRQWTLLQIKDELIKRGLKPESFKPQIADVTCISIKPNYKPIEDILNKKGCVKAVKLEKFSGLLHTLTQEYTHFSKEFSDRVRVIACITDIPNIAYSETMEIDARYWRKVKDILPGTGDDVWVLVWSDNDEDSQTAAQEVSIRAKEALLGVPSETRQALKDGTTGFERILPGPDRMYPDTDLPPIEITEERLKRLEKNIAELPSIQYKKYKDMNLSNHLANQLVNSKWRQLFEYVVNKYKLKASVIASYFTGYIKHLERKNYDLPEPDAPIWKWLFEEFSTKRFYKEALPYISIKIGSGEGLNSIISSMSPVLDDKTDYIIDETLNIYRYIEYRHPEKKFEFLMGKIMYKYGGLINPIKLKQSLKDCLEERNV
ncbi:MAG: Glu-tRNA(Gln) amidotransferase subunit GatE, partial [Spirochaetota bacterium]